MKQVLVVLSLLTAVLESRLFDGWQRPWFCHELDCPRYVNTGNKTIRGKTVEIRVYEAALWSETVIENTELGSISEFDKSDISDWFMHF